MNRSLVPGPSLTRFHADVIAEMQKVIEFHTKPDDLMDGSVDKIDSKI